MRRLKTVFILALMLAFGREINAQYAPGESKTPLPFYKGNDIGYAILRDGSKIEGNINVGKRELAIKNKGGVTYRLEDYSLKEYGLNTSSAQNYSPVQFYEWKDKKVKEYLYFGSTDDFNSNVKTKAQRGFVVLKNGEVKNGLIELDGKVKIVGGFHSSNIFALDELKFEDDKGVETKYKDSDLKGFGRTLPWNLSPAWMYKEGPALMGMATKKMPGFVITYDGKKVEGEMSLFKQFVQNPNPNAGGGMMVMPGDYVAPEDKKTALAEFYKTATVNTSGGKEKFDIDEVMAYGLSGMTMNGITKNGAQTYPVDKMNFHRGSVETKDGNKEGFVAHFPGPVNYYGVYFAKSPDDELEVYSYDDVKNVKQNISEIEEFVGFGDLDVSTSPNTNLNGYIINRKGEKVKGTIKLNEANELWARSAEFTNEENLTTTYGGENGRVRYLVIESGDQKGSYVQNQSIFVKGELEIPENIFTYYMNPFPKSSSFIGAMAAGMLESAVNNTVSDATAGVDAAAASKGWESQNTGSNDLVLSEYGNFINVEKLPAGAAKAMFKDELVVYSSKTNEKMTIPKKGMLRGKTQMEILLEGCLEYHSLDKDKKKSLAQYENSVDAISFINECYK